MFKVDDQSFVRNCSILADSQKFVWRRRSLPPKHLLNDIAAATTHQRKSCNREVFGVTIIYFYTNWIKKVIGSTICRVCRQRAVWEAFWSQCCRCVLTYICVRMEQYQTWLSLLSWKLLKIRVFLESQSDFPKPETTKTSNEIRPRRKTSQLYQLKVFQRTPLFQRLHC